MPRLNRTARSSALAIMTYACLAMIGPMSFAQENDAASRQFSAKVGEVVLEAQSLITANEFQAALNLLNEAGEITDLTPYERSIIGQMQGASHYQLDQYDRAISAFERAIAAGGLLSKEVDEMRVQIAQLLIANGQFRQGAEGLESYLNEGGQLKPQYIELLLQGWIRAEDYEKALPWAEKWFMGARPKERKHFDLMNFIYNQLGERDQQIDIVKDMIQHWPSEKALWESWASLLSWSGQEKEAFEVTKQIYISGFEMTERELMKVVQYYSYYNMPYQAAGLLEKEMNMGRINRSPENLEQLASLLRQSREYKRAIPILAAATEKAGSANLYAQLGEALYNEGLCERAEIAFKQAIDRGYDAGKAWTLIASCRYEATQKLEALSCEMSGSEKAAAPLTQTRQSSIAAFEKVPQASPQSRDAKKWISFISTERDTFDRRCDFEEQLRRDECMKEIDGHYAIRIFDMGAKLSEKCQPYLVEYNQTYRVKVTG